MSKRSILPQSRRHIFVYDEDWLWISSRYTGIPLGAGAACREMIHIRVKAMRQREIDLAEQTKTEEEINEASRL